MPVLISLHALAAVIWVGGLFFVVAILRPAVSSVPLAERLPILSQAIGRFFLWVWIAVPTLLITGYAMTFMLGAVPAYVYVMQGLGWGMILLYVGIFFGPWQRMRAALAAGALADAARAMSHLRLIAIINLVLGLLVVVVAVGGRYGLL